MKTRCAAALLALFLCFGWAQPMMPSSCPAADVVSASVEDCAPVAANAVAHEDQGRHNHAAAPDAADGDTASTGGACGVQLCCVPQAIDNAQSTDVFFVGLHIELVTNHADALISSLHVDGLLRPPASLTA